MPDLRTRGDTNPVVRGRVGGLGRSPKRYSEGRTCSHPDCSEQLSVYNRKRFCHRHWPIIYPRCRGTHEFRDGSV